MDLSSESHVDVEAVGNMCSVGEGQFECIRLDKSLCCHVHLAIKFQRHMLLLTLCYVYLVSPRLVAT